MKIWIPHRPIHVILFLLLAFLCYQAHQLTRYVVGATLCRGFGTMTFTVATTREPCTYPTVVVLSGPVLTYGLAYFGAFLYERSSVGTAFGSLLGIWFIVLAVDLVAVVLFLALLPRGRQAAS